MPRPADQPYLDLLYTAYNTPHGIIVATQDLDITRSKLTAVRKRHGNLKLYEILITRGPDDKLWLVKGQGSGGQKWWQVDVGK